MERLKIGDVCILDPKNEYDLKPYHPTFVRIIRRVWFGKFEVQNVSDTVDYMYDNRFNAPWNRLIVPKNRLAKLNKTDRVVIRTDLGNPIISDHDLDTYRKILHCIESKKHFDKKDVEDFKALYFKLRIYYFMRGVYNL